MKLLQPCFILALSVTSILADCARSITTFTKDGISNTNVCSGELLFEENFDSLDTSRWAHEVSLAGFGNGEFEYYTDDRRVSYTKDGILHIQPRLLSSDEGDSFLYSGTIDLGNACTNPDDSGCRRTGQPGQILNPVLSARMRTVNSFSFRYGRLEARMKVPTGNWLWPAFWLMPTQSKYGQWPRSGEIDVMESRGNLDMGYPFTATSTLHWGPDSVHNMWSRTHFSKGDISGYAAIFHTFQLEWTPASIKFSVDNHHYGTVAPPNGGFWELGNLDGSGLQNPWAGQGVMAPFDQEFHILINVAIGGTNGYFPESWGKPWKNGEDRFEAMTKFWEARSEWLDSWKMNTEDSHFQVDYVRVWAL